MESVINLKSEIERSTKGDSAAFELLYKHLVDQVFAFVSYRTSSKSDAVEVTQDCFIELHKALQKFTYQSDAAFYSFVFVIVRRKLASYYESTAKHKTEIIDEIQHQAPDQATELVISVQSALAKLDEVSREIIVLHHWSKYTFAEIASFIDMTESAVRVRHHRAKAELATILTS